MNREPRGDTSREIRRLQRRPLWGCLVALGLTLAVAALILLAAGCTSYTPPHSGPRHTPGVIAFAAGTGSMLPAIRKGDAFALIWKPIEQVRVGADGEFVAIYLDGRKVNVIHRALRRGVAANGEPYLIVKGHAGAERLQ
jgi:hypothetical protein